MSKNKHNWGIQLQLQIPKHLYDLIKKYGQDEFDGAFATEMQFHADEVSVEQIEHLIIEHIESEDDEENEKELI